MCLVFLGLYPYLTSIFWLRIVQLKKITTNYKSTTTINVKIG